MICLLGPVLVILKEIGVTFSNFNKKSITTPIHNNRYQYHVLITNDDTSNHTQATIVLVTMSSK